VKAPTSRPALTRLQRKVLSRLGSYIRKNGRSPSYRELMRLCEVTNVHSISSHLDALQRKGYVTRTPRVSKSIKIVEAA